MFRRCIILATSVAFLSYGAANSALAVTKTSNVASGAWTSSGSWSPAGVPAFNDDAVIGSTAGTNPSIISLDGNTNPTPINNLFIGNSNPGTGTLNIGNSSAATLNVYAMLRMADQSGASNGTLTLSNGSAMTVWGSAYIGKATTTGTATISLNNSTLNIGTDSGTDSSNVFFAEASGSRATLNFNAGGVMNIGNTNTTGFISPNVFFGGNAGTTNAYTQLNFNGGTMNLGNGSSLFFRASNTGQAANGVINPVNAAVYTLPLSNTVAAGKMVAQRSISIADQTSNIVAVTIDAASGAAATLQQFGTLTVGTGTNANGTLNLTGSNMTFHGNGAFAFSGQRGFNGGTTTATVNLTNATLFNAQGALELAYSNVTSNAQANLTLTNSTLTVRDYIAIGSNNVASGRASITLDTASQLNSQNGALIINGNNNGGGQQTYAMALASTAANGKISFDRGLVLGDAGTTGSNVQLNITSAGAANVASTSLKEFGQFTVALGSGNPTTAVMNDTGVNMEFHANDIAIAGKRGFGGGTPTGTLNLTDATVRATSGALELAYSNNTSNAVANLNLTNSTIAVRDYIGIGSNSQSNGKANITLDVNSQITAQNGALQINGNNSAGGQQTYALALASTGISSSGQNGKISFDRGLSIGNINAANVQLNITSAGAANVASASNLNEFGQFILGTAGNSPTVILNDSGVNMQFHGGNNIWIAADNSGNANVGTATLNLTNASIRATSNGVNMAKGRNGVANLNFVNSQLSVRDNISIGNGTGTDASGLQGLVNFNLDATSQLNSQNGALILQGGNNAGGTQTYNLALTTLGTGWAGTNGKIAFDRGLQIASGSNNQIQLNISSATSTTLKQFGQLQIAGSSSGGQNNIGILNDNGVRMEFHGGGNMRIASDEGGNATAGNGTLSLTNSTVLVTSNGLSIGRGRNGGNGTVGNLNLTNSTLMVRDSITTGETGATDAGNLQGIANFNLDVNSQLNSQNGSLVLNGGNNAGGQQAYNLALASTPTNGKISFDRGLAIGNVARASIQLNITSAGAANVASASTIKEFGQLTIGTGGNANDNGFNDVGVNMEFHGGGDLTMATGTGTTGVTTLGLTDASLRVTSNGLNLANNTTNNSNLAVLNLTNSSLTVRDNIQVGGGNATGRATFTLDVNSQLNSQNGALILGGANNAGPGLQTYALAISSTPQNGKISFDRGLQVANGSGLNGGGNNVQLNITNAGAANVASSSTIKEFGQLLIGTAANATAGTLNDIGVNMDFHGGDMSMANGNNSGVVATLNLTDATVRNTAGALNLSFVNANQNTNLSNLTLTNSSLTARDKIQIGQNQNAQGRASLTIDANSQLNTLTASSGGGLYLDGSNAGAQQTYAVKLGDSYKSNYTSGTTNNGMLSFQGSLAIAENGANNVQLNALAGGAAKIRASGNLVIANSGNGLGTMNLDTTSLDFAGSGSIGTGNSTTNKGLVTLTNGAGLAARGNLSMRQNNTNGTATITSNNTATTVLDGGNSFKMDGRVVVASSGVLNVDYGALSNDINATGSVTQNDGTLSGWVVNAGSGGQIVQKTITGVTNASSFSFGDATAGSTFLVNSIRFNTANVNTSGNLAGGVLDVNSWAGGTDKVSAFNLQTAGGLVLNANPFASMVIRYNSAAVSGTESALRVFQLVGGVWVDKTSGAVDTVNHRITTVAGVDPSLGDFIIAEVAPTGTATVAITPFAGNRAATTTNIGANGAQNWSSATWTSATPQSRDTVTIGQGAFTTPTVTLNSGTQGNGTNENILQTLSVGTVAAGNASLNIDAGVNAGTSLRVTTGNLTIASAGTGSISVTNGGGLQIDQGANIATSANTTGTLTVDGAGSYAYISNSVSAGTNNTASIANINVTNGGNLDIRGNLTAGSVGPTTTNQFNLTIDGTSKMSVLGDITLHGGTNTTTSAVYTLPLSDAPAAGKLAQRGNLDVANQANENVTLNIDSTLALGQAADTSLSRSGGLFLANGFSTRVQANFKGVNVDFGGALQMSVNTQSITTLNLTNSSLRFMGGISMANSTSDGGAAQASSVNINLVNSKLETRTTFFVGGNNFSGRANLSIDSNSQLNILGDLALNGGNNGTTGSSMTYTLPLANNPTNGKISMRAGSLNIASSNNSNVSIVVDAAQGAVSGTTLDGNLLLANGFNTKSTGTFTGVNVDFGGALNMAINTQSTATLNLTNGTMRFMSGISMANSTQDTGAASASTANINLVNSVLETRGTFFVGGGNFSGRLNLSMDSNSQLNILGDLSLNGGNNGTTGSSMTYTLPLANDPTNGKISMRAGSLNIASSNNSNVSIVVDVAQGAVSGTTLDGNLLLANGLNTQSTGTFSGVNMDFGGALNMAINQQSTATLNLTNSNMRFMGSVGLANSTQDTSNTQTSTSNINLVNSTLETRGSFTVGSGNQGGGRMNLSIDANSQLNILGDLNLNGGNNGTNGSSVTYTLPLVNDPTNGKISMRAGSLNVAGGQNANVRLVVDSSLGAASNLTLDGNLNVGSGTNTFTGVQGIATFNGVNVDFGGSLSMAINTNDTATLNLTNSNMRFMGSVSLANIQTDTSIATPSTSNINLVNSKLETRGSLTVGGTNQGAGRMNLSIDANSQLNILGDLNLNGGNNGTNGSSVTYTLALANDPTNGKISMRAGSLNVAGGQNGNVRLVVDSSLGAASNLTLDGNLVIASGTNNITGPQGVATFNGVNVDFGGSLSMAINTNNTATLNLTNSNMRFMGSVAMANTQNDGNLPTTSVANINLVNSKLETRSSFTVGGTNQGAGRMNLTMDGNSQVNILNDLNLRGGNNGTNGSSMTYVLPLASTAGNGKFSFRDNLNLAANQNSKVNLTVDSTLAAGQAADTSMYFNGGLNMDTASNTTSTLVLKNVATNWGGAVLLGNNATALATINMNNSSINSYSSFTVRNTMATTSKTVIQGTGNLSAAGTFANNDRIVADGGTLNITAGWISSSFDTVNQLDADGKRPGWYAINAGKLTLPAMSITSAANSSWGESNTDTTLDMVNSMRFTGGTFFTNSNRGLMSGSVLAPSNAGMPSGLMKIASAFDFSGLLFSATNAGTMEVRYDDIQSAANGSTEANLKLWHYVDKEWQNITASIDTVNHRITSTTNGVTSLSPFAVAESVNAYYWKGGTNNDWGTAGTNWYSDIAATTTTTVPTTLTTPSSDGTLTIYPDVYFTVNNPPGASNITPVSLTTSVDVNKIKFEGTGTTSDASGVTISGAGTLNIKGADGIYDVSTTAAHTINTSVVLGINQLWTNKSTGALTIGGNVSGGFSLTFDGVGTVVLSGTNSYVNSTISAGTLQIGANTTTGTLGSGTVVDNSALVFNRSNTYTVANTISGTGTVTQNNATGITVLTAGNSYDGLTSVTAGVLRAQNNTALGSTVGGTTVASGAALQLQGTIVIGAEALSLDGTGISNDGALRNIIDNNSYGGTITLGGSPVRINSDAGLLTLNAVNAITGVQNLTIGGAGNTTVSGTITTGVGTLTKDGTGTVVLSGVSGNTFTGTTTVLNGELQLNKTAGQNAIGGDLTVTGGTAKLMQSNQISDARNVVVNGGTFDVQTFNDSVNGVQLATGNINGTSGVLTSLTTFDMQSGNASAILGGAAGMNKTTTGTVFLSGNSTYTGVTAISNGVLEADANNALGAAGVGNGTTVSGGATLRLLAGLNYSTAEALSINGTGYTGIGALTTTGVGTTTFNGQVNFATDATVNANGGTLTLTGGVVKNGTTATFTGGGTININSVISGTSLPGTSLTIDNTLLVLNVGSTYSSDTIIKNNGTLKLGVSPALPISPLTAMIINSGGTLDLASFSDSVFSLTGALDALSTVQNSVSGTSTLTINGGAPANFAGVISGTAGGDVALTKDGGGTQTLSGTLANTFTGVTTVNGGTLDLGKSAGVNAIGGDLVIGDGTLTDTVRLQATEQIPDASDVTINSNGVLNLNGKSETIDGLSGSGTVNNTTGTPVTFTLGGGNQPSATFTGVIQNSGGGALSLTKTGTGTQALAGASTYTGGTLITNGKLLANNTTGSATGTGNVSVTGGILGGSGAVSGAVTISGTGALSPGNSIESLSTGALTLNGGSYDYELTTSPLDGDLVDVSGNLTLLGTVNLNLTDLGIDTLLPGGSKLTLISYSGVWNGGIFAGYADDSIFTFGSNQWLINYNDLVAGSNILGGGAGPNYVTITTFVPSGVPEPSTLALAGLGLAGLGLMVWRRRRQK